MGRNVDRIDRPVSVSGSECPRERAGWSETVGDEERLPGGLLFLLAAEIVAFAALSASGNMPQIVTVLFRALLTL